MKNFLIALFSLVVSLGFLGLPIGFLTKKLYIKVTGELPTLKDIIVCFTPIYNLYWIRYIMYGSALVYKVYSYIFAVYFTLLMIVRFAIAPATSAGQVLNVLMTLISYIMMVLLWILVSYCMNDLTNYYKAPQDKLWAFICPPVCAWFLLRKIDYYYKLHPEEDGGSFIE